MTSRPDERFRGWLGFDVSTVLPLTEDNARLLIERADYNIDLKRKFLAKFDELFKRYGDFLKNPLLAYMMLVSFSFNPDIPNRMFLFYEQAFEALYRRHDLTKSYKRKFHCNLDKMQFIRLISFFCLKTYYDEDFEFSKNRGLEIIDDVKKIEGIEVNSEEFFEDLVQSVCILKSEGITHTFTHRSFQEYFAAYCISRVAIRNIDKLLARFSKRFTDSVLPMVADINADLFREKFIMKNEAKFRSFTRRKSERRLYESFAEKTGAVFHIHEIESFMKRMKRERSRKGGVKRSLEPSISLSYDGEMADFFKVIRGVLENTGSLRISGNGHSDSEFVELLSRTATEPIKSASIFTLEGEVIFQVEYSEDERGMEAVDDRLLGDAFRRTKMHQFLTMSATKFLEFVRAEKANYNNVSDAFEELF